MYEFTYIWIRIYIYIYFSQILFHYKLLQQTEYSSLCYTLGPSGFPISLIVVCIKGFPGGSDGKESACNAEDLGSMPGLGGSLREGVGNPLHYSCLKNFMDRGAWLATVHRVTKSRTHWVTNTFSVSNKQFTELSKEPGLLPCTQTASRRQTHASVRSLIGWLGKRACRCRRPFSSLNSDIQIVGVVSGNSTQHLFRMSERIPVFFQKIFSLNWLWDG